MPVQSPSEVLDVAAGGLRLDRRKKKRPMAPRQTAEGGNSPLRGRLNSPSPSTGNDDARVSGRQVGANEKGPTQSEGPQRGELFTESSRREQVLLEVLERLASTPEHLLHEPALALT